MAKRLAPEVNAGSMADIAFLLLIFFLVTTTIETDYGINRNLPPLAKDVKNSVIKGKNLFTIKINDQNELFVEENYLDMKDVKKAVIDFLDNGGGQGEKSCSYCRGAGNSTSSENPKSAVISLVHSRDSDYDTYIAIQDELVKAYLDLRNRESLKMYGTSYIQMTENYKNPGYKENRTLLKERIDTIREMFPERISEVEPLQENP